MLRGRQWIYPRIELWERRSWCSLGRDQKGKDSVGHVDGRVCTMFSSLSSSLHVRSIIRFFITPKTATSHIADSVALMVRADVHHRCGIQDPQEGTYQPASLSV